MTPLLFALPQGPVLVIAPHPDDETLGCGGLIAASVRAGHRVHTVFVTEGGASHPACRSWTRPERAAQREAEAENGSFASSEQGSCHGAELGLSEQPRQRREGNL